MESAADPLAAERFEPDVGTEDDIRCQRQRSRSRAVPVDRAGSFGVSIPWLNHIEPSVSCPAAVLTGANEPARADQAGVSGSYSLGLSPRSRFPLFAAASGLHNQAGGRARSGESVRKSRSSRIIAASQCVGDRIRGSTP